MRKTDLRTAAAYHFLGLSDSNYLVDVAHAALNQGIYAHGLGEIATSRNPILSDIGPLFDSALKELEISITGWDHAVSALVEAYLVAIAEGAGAPELLIRQVYDDYQKLHYDQRGRRLEDQRFGPLSQLVEFYYQYEYQFYDVHGQPDAQLIERHDLKCIDFAREWCRKHWQPTLDRTWLTSTVFALAQGIDNERAFDRLPILADALQDAGCDNADILDHCRGPGPHVRGCWVVDLVLGKE